MMFGVDGECSDIRHSLARLRYSYLYDHTKDRF